MPHRSSKADSWLTLLGASLIAGAGVIAYHNIFSGPFVYDDLPSIVDNPTIQHLWPPWAALSPPGGGATVEGRPILNLSLAINYAISGKDVWSYHALNLLIHLCSGLLLFGIARRTFDQAEGHHSFGIEERSWAACAWALAIALLWTVHPLQTEAVTYVIQRAESLMGMFYLLTLYFFILSIREKTGPGFSKWALFSILSCFLGTATKEVTITAPVMVFLYDRTFGAGSFSEAWRRRKGYYACLAASWILFLALFLKSGANRSGTVGFGTGVSWGAYVLTQFPAIVHYLRLSVWPSPLIFEYGTLWVSPAHAAPYAAVVLALAALTVWALVKRPALGFLGFWFFGILAPTSLAPGTTQMIVEHRMYLPLAAVITLFVLGLRALVRRVLPSTVSPGAPSAAQTPAK